MSEINVGDEIIAAGSETTCHAVLVSVSPAVAHALAAA